MKTNLLILLLLSTCCLETQAQGLTPSPSPRGEGEMNTLTNSKFYQSINKKVLSLKRNVEERSLKALKRMQKQEDNLRKKLAKKDSLTAQKLFAQNKYQELTDQLQHPVANKQLKEYIPQFDSLKTSLKFLEQSKELSSKLPMGFADKISTANLNVASLETKMQQAEDIKNYIRERKQLLKEQLGKYDMLKDMKSLNKEAYYYSQQLNEYKAILKDPKKIEEKAMEALKKISGFEEFIGKNSMLGSLFPTSTASPAENLTGFQTRANLQGQLQQRFGGNTGMQHIQDQMQAGTAELAKIKNKLKAAGITDDLAPAASKAEGGFTPNNQKTKSFLQRLEYSLNVQTQRPNNLLPVTSDLALNAGYRINDKSTIGIGAGYKLGWGNGFKEIRLSSQGLGLRSYVDYKLKGSFWLSGGYEKNYQHEFTKLSELNNLDAWQASGLIGIMKKYKIGKKTNNLQLFWDFLSYKQKPVT